MRSSRVNAVDLVVVVVVVVDDTQLSLSTVRILSLNRS